MSKVLGKEAGLGAGWKAGKSKRAGGQEVVGSVGEKGLDQGVRASGDQKKKGHLGELLLVKERKVSLSARSLSLCGEGTGENASADREASRKG